MQNVDLLIVDDDEEFRSTLVRRFRRRGFQVEDAAGGEPALARLERRRFDVAIIDMVMPGMNGLELLGKLKAAQPECEVIMLTGQGTIESAVEAMKQGAHDYLQKPFPLDELELIAQRASQHGRLQKENQQLKAVIGRNAPRHEMIGQSAAMKEVLRLI
jgi:DNA-binding NtrC family response regulator